MTTAKDPVLVVGGRTTGLMMASELARHGVPVRIIDKSPGIDPHSRATFIHSRTQEIFHTLGIVDEVIDSGQLMRGICFYSNGAFVGRSKEDEADSPFPVGIALSQAKTEALLERHLNSFGVTVERNTQLSDFFQRPDRVQATLKTADGREVIVDTPWLIGCDGAHSTVRHLTEEDFPGEADPYPYVLADVIVDGPLDPDDSHVFLNDHGDLFYFMLDEGRRLIVASVPKDSDLSEAPTLDIMQDIVSQRSFPECRLSDPRWLCYFHINYRLAHHYRHGRTFLAGDAAHIHSLIGGQGMNTGIQDAHNLAWKLALVHRNVVPYTWLSTYETERRRVAKDVIECTRNSTQQAELFADLSQQERKKLVEHMFVPESQKAQARQHAEELDLDYQSSPICFETDEGFDGGPECGTRAPDAVPILVGDKPCSLFDLFRSPNHQLLFFLGTANVDRSAELTSAVNMAIEMHGHWMKVNVVAGPESQVVLPPEATIINDPQGAFHQRYAAETASLYLIRPDGYVAYRSNRLNSLGDYLARVL